jgi:hypothetical protein
MQQFNTLSRIKITEIYFAGKIQNSHVCTNFKRFVGTVWSNSKNVIYILFGQKLINSFCARKKMTPAKIKYDLQLYVQKKLFVFCFLF